MLMNRLKPMGGGVGAGGLCATGHGGATLMSVLCATDHGGGCIFN